MRCPLCHNFYYQAPSIQEYFIGNPYQEEQLCPSCKTQFMSLKALVVCPYCGKIGENCTECELWQQRYHLQHQALYAYNKAAKRYLHALKYQGNYALVKVFRQALQHAFAPYYKEYHLQALPSDPQRLLERGFNPTQALLAETTYPLYDGLGKKVAPPQAQKTKAERLASPQSFYLKVQPTNIQGQKFLLFDDIYTTGRTLTHAYALLQEAGAKEVRSLSLFRA